MSIQTVEPAPLHVGAGPLLSDFAPAKEPEAFSVLARWTGGRSPSELIEEIDRSGLRGRAGGGFPTALKWSQVATAEQKRRFFVCNANAGQPGGFKERFLLRRNPARVLEAVALGAWAVGAEAAFVYLGRGLREEERLLREALDEALDRPVFRDLGTRILIVRSLAGYIAGEETAALEMIEGKPAQPRVKPPLPTATGLLGAPTSINNLETTLQAFHVAKFGADAFRAVGADDSPGTMLFALSGMVNRPGLYELPLGVPLRDLLFEHGMGPRGRLKVVFPGGVGSVPLGEDQLDVPLDFDSLREAGSDLGSGVTIVVAEETGAVDLARRLAAFFYENSCGKCQPCKDGTSRTLAMLGRLSRLDEKNIDLLGRSMPASPRQAARKDESDGAVPLPVLNETIAPGAGGISYTDTVQGLEKINHLCEWYKHRGDCHHPVEAASSIQALLRLFRSEFEAEAGLGTALG